MLTIRRHKGGFENLSVAIVGDILHSRVARSNRPTANKFLPYRFPFVMSKIRQHAQHICCRGWHGNTLLTTGTLIGMRRKSDRLLRMRPMFTSTEERQEQCGGR